MGTVYVFFGLIASGKSYLGKRFAQAKGCSCFNSDVVRKELAGLVASESGRDAFGKGIYSSEYTRRTYQRLAALAKEELESGNDCVLDASFNTRAYRSLLLSEVEAETKIYFIYCFCEEDVVQKRLAIRAQDSEAVSDGNWEIYCLQKAGFEYPAADELPNLLKLNTDRDAGEMIKELVSLV